MEYWQFDLDANLGGKSYVENIRFYSKDEYFSAIRFLYFSLDYYSELQQKWISVWDVDYKWKHNNYRDIVFIDATPSISLSLLLGSVATREQNLPSYLILPKDSTWRLPRVLNDKILSGFHMLLDPENGIDWAITSEMYDSYGNSLSRDEIYMHLNVDLNHKTILEEFADDLKCSYTGDTISFKENINGWKEYFKLFAPNIRIIDNDKKIKSNRWQSYTFNPDNWNNPTQITIDYEDVDPIEIVLGPDINVTNFELIKYIKDNWIRIDTGTTDLSDTEWKLDLHPCLQSNRGGWIGSDLLGGQADVYIIDAEGNKRDISHKDTTLERIEIYKGSITCHYYDDFIPVPNYYYFQNQKDIDSYVQNWWSQYTDRVDQFEIALPGLKKAIQDAFKQMQPGKWQYWDDNLLLKKIEVKNSSPIYIHVHQGESTGTDIAMLERYASRIDDTNLESLYGSTWRMDDFVGGGGNSAWLSVRGWDVVNNEWYVLDGTNYYGSTFDENMWFKYKSQIQNDVSNVVDNQLIVGNYIVGMTFNLNNLALDWHIDQEVSWHIGSEYPQSLIDQITETGYPVKNEATIKPGSWYWVYPNNNTMQFEIRNISPLYINFDKEAHGGNYHNGEGEVDSPLNNINLRFLDDKDNILFMLRYASRDFEDDDDTEAEGYIIVGTGDSKILKINGKIVGQCNGKYLKTLTTIKADGTTETIKLFSGIIGNSLISSDGFTLVDSEGNILNYKSEDR